ncbi:MULTISPECIES: hypothetical protein [Actinoalloteichus]|uniref:Uncharacterized protein n=1 Tax=Actinoalloteichus fjordicus TaxID=1612552 RepID=A0AAC9LDC2_9PSEU|nr:MULTISPECIES: hypothetical protein [Actinoalloteichus]APU14799.1 hypothetical protein UA74_13705 [Actinoalloteichus fjordicus]APU20770.1 hypothetical protein UA75_13800 [Actinoalloteichus sp. GBA129-24]
MSVDRRSKPRCPSCGREDLVEASRHRTSEGMLSYLRCSCGRWLVVRSATLLATAMPGWWEPASARERAPWRRRARAQSVLDDGSESQARETRGRL